MARLIYTAIASLDGYVVDAAGDFDWAAPGEEVHQAVDDLERDTGTYLLGRRMYETMGVWDTMPTEHASPAVRDYADVWRAAEKVVYSRSLDAVRTARTRLEREFDPAAVRRMVDSAARDVSVGGPTLASSALRAGIVDELRLIIVPVVIGGGTRWLPDGLRCDLTLVEQRALDSRTALLRYRVY